MARRDGKWDSHLNAAMPVAEAAERTLKRRLEAVGRLLRRAASDAAAGKAEAAHTVHALRVSTRRAEAAIDVFGALLSRRECARAGDVLKKVRRAAGSVRDCDVQAAGFGELGKLRGRAGNRGRALALKHLKSSAGAARSSAAERLTQLASELPGVRLRKRWSELLRTIRIRPKRSGLCAESRLIDLARTVLDGAVAEVRSVAGGDLSDLDRVHELRIALKRLRYALELLGSCFGADFRERVYPRLVGVQRCLGEVNDAYFLAGRLRKELKGLKPARDGAAARKTRRVEGAAEVKKGLELLLREQEEVLRRGHAAFLKEWEELAGGAVFDQLKSDLLGAAAAGGARAGKMQDVEAVMAVAAAVEAKPLHALNGVHKAAGAGKAHGTRPGRRRIAAIDIGTNSIRLIVAEADSSGSYRILDDEKEITRLGKGLHATGRMDPAAVEHTAVAVARMKSIALGYGAEEIRVVGTAAAREAKNSDLLHRKLLERAGVKMQVITGEQEALLAYRSAANAFDLAAAPALVIDIGGGSTEMVLSAAVRPGAEDRRAGLGGGAIEHVFTVPVGAVRLTEMFGGPEAAGGKRFEDMRRYVKRLLKEQVGRPPLLPQTVVGTGGTLTTLGAMLMLRELGPSGDGLFSGGVQGSEVARAELKHLLDYIRKVPIKDRTKVPGLSADRADIIVAGLVIVDAVLKRFGANRLRVHEGGIRDGLLLAMVQQPEGQGGNGDRPDPMKAVRRFAKACGYEAGHARHVCGLALEIFDQMAEAGRRAGIGRGKWGGMAFDDRERLLLEAAALLHDVGYLINYAQHHKHSYHLIVHADLPGLTTREVQVVANVARYHRAAEPKEKHRNFAGLDEADKQLVRGLSAVLRIADGLDRTHMQSVRGVRIRISGESAHFVADAAEEPAVDLWGAVRKSGLFKSTFGLLPHLEWAKSERAAKEASSGRSSSGVSAQVLEKSQGASEIESSTMRGLGPK